MLIPKFLKQGDLIGVPAPSDGSNCLEKEKRFAKCVQEKM